MWDIQKEQMENFQTRKKETIERCRQIQIEAEASVLETQRLKKTERTELCEQEKRKIKRKYDEKVEVDLTVTTVFNSQSCEYNLHVLVAIVIQVRSTRFLML